jgi:hypothetical protein
MRDSWVISATISVGLLTSCSVQPSLSEDYIEDEIKLPLIGEELEDEQISLFHQDQNKSYSQIDRPWVLAKPLLEHNKSNSFLLKDE